MSPEAPTGRLAGLFPEDPAIPNPSGPSSSAGCSSDKEHRSRKRFTRDTVGDSLCAQKRVLCVSEMPFNIPLGVSARDLPISKLGKYLPKTLEVLRVPVVSRMRSSTHSMALDRPQKDIHVLPSSRK